MRRCDYSRKYEGYREDEELYVYDQDCGNCGNMDCPMRLPETAEEHYERFGTLEDFDEAGADERYGKVMKLREEDAEIRNNSPVWCIYWQSQGRRKH